VVTPAVLMAIEKLRDRRLRWSATLRSRMAVFGKS